MKNRKAITRMRPKAAITPTPVTAKPSGVQVSAEVRLDPRNPVPFEYGGFGMASGSGFYLPFLTTSDNFFNTLLELRTLSVTHNACITTKTDFVIGRGLHVTNLKEGEKVDENFAAFLSASNGLGKSLSDICRRAMDSRLTFGNAPVEVVRGSVAGQKFVYIYSHEVLECRLEKPNPAGEIEHMVYSPRFRRKGLLSDPKTTLFVPLWRKSKTAKVWRKDGPIERTAFWLKNEMAGYKHYGMPSSVSSIQNQQLEHGGERYNMDELDNQMVVGGLVVLTGNLAQGEADKIGRKIVNQHTGAGKRGRVAVVASEQGIENSKFLSFDTKKEGSYEKMGDKAMQKILLSNQWDATLAGLSDGGAMGKGSGYLKELYDQKMATVIGPLQEILLSDLIAPLLQICDEWMGTTWSKYKLGFIPLPIVNRANSELATSAEGIRVTLEVAKAVVEGFYTHEAAVKLISVRFGISEQDASDLIPKPAAGTKTNTNV